jgi:hypothetical protein
VAARRDLHPDGQRLHAEDPLRETFGGQLVGNARDFARKRHDVILRCYADVGRRKTWVCPLLGDEVLLQLCIDLHCHNLFDWASRRLN